MKEIVIIGGGFAGLNAAKVLGQNPGVKVTLFDRRNYHLFQPLLYQVATAGLSPAEIAMPIRSVLSQYKNVSVVLGEVTEIDLHRRQIFCGADPHSYDYLIVASGATHSYFGHSEWERYAPGLKTLEQATEIRRRILIAFERAEVETNLERQKELLTFVIVGGGPTGVELAGAIAEIGRQTLRKDFRRIDPAQTRVLLIEAGERILPSFSENLSAKATRDLRTLGVQIRTSTRVTRVDNSGVSIGDEVVRATTVLWAAGVKPSSLGSKLGVPFDRVGRVIVERDLSLKHHPEVFVLGDLAAFTDRDGKTLPGLAPVAMQQGRHAAANILRDISGQTSSQTRTEFIYLNKGEMATIGRSKAVMQIGNLEVSGIIAWLAWLFVHVLYLIGFKNRFFVLFQWAWSYLTFRRGARLILEKG